VKVVKSKEEIRAFAEHWLGKRLVTYQTDANGQPVNQILVEAATDIAKSCTWARLLTVAPVAWCSWRLPKAAWKSKKWRKKPRT
jgi:succinyl-CoA synthetase beta subunit